MEAIKLFGQSNAELGERWSQFDLRQQRQIVPKIVEFVTIDDASEKVTVKLKLDALDYLKT